MTKFKKKQRESLSMQNRGEQIDIELLKECLSQQAESYNDIQQAKVTNFFLDKAVEICDTTESYWEWETDKRGNSFFIKGQADLYPAIVFHLDDVHDHNPNKEIHQVGDWVIAIDSSTGEQIGTACDDKMGMYLALEMIRLHDNVKVAMYKDEEVGCKESTQASVDFFSDVAFMIQPDRNYYGQKDYINHTNGIAVTTDEFDAEIKDILKEWDYIPATGSLTDIGEIVSNGAGCCAFNLSCYFNAHTDQEVAHVGLTRDALNFMNDVILKMSHKRWEIEVEEYKTYSYTDKWSDWDRYDREDDPWNTDVSEMEVDEVNALIMSKLECDSCTGEEVEDDLAGGMWCRTCQKYLNADEVSEIWNAIC